MSTGHFELESPESLTSLYTAIVEQAKACHFWESIPEDKMTDAESVLAYLHELLTDLKTYANAYGFAYSG